MHSVKPPSQLGLPLHQKEGLYRGNLYYQNGTMKISNFHKVKLRYNISFLINVK